MSNDQQALSRLHELALLRATGPGLQPLLREALDAAIAVSGADFGTLQLVDPLTDDLVIAVQHGLPPAWIDFWGRAGECRGACHAALLAKDRIVVEDVASSPLFTGSEALAVQLAAGVRAVQSTPLLTRGGTALGVLSTHFRSPRKLENATLKWLDLLARQAADMIELHQAGAQREEERQRLEALLQALPVGVAFTQSPGCEHVIGNTALRAMFGVGFDENLSATAGTPESFGRRVGYRQDGQAVAPQALPLQRAAREGLRVGPVELEISMPDREPLTVEVTAAPLVGADGKQAGAVAVVVDVMERRRADDAVAQVRLKDEFLAVLSHELRNPLAAIAAAVEGWQKDKTPEERESMSELISRQVEMLTRLVDDLADVSRVANGQLALNLATVSLTEILDNAAAMLLPAARKRRQRIAVVAPVPDVLFQGDGVRLIQILVNLLDNASKYTGAGGHIELRGGLEGGHVVLRCCDDGQGIEPHMLNRIFEPLVRAPAAKLAAPGGLGLGLTLIERLAHLHGGSATVSSRGSRCGSEFVVRIPYVEAAGKPGDSPGPADGPRPATQAADAPPLRTLYVEDHPDVAAATTDLLRSEGLQVQTAASASEALAAAMGMRPRLLLCDMNLPDMSGLELIRRLKPQLAAWKTHVVITTGYSDAQLATYARHAPEFGVAEFVSKPFSVEWLRSLRDRLQQP